MKKWKHLLKAVMAVGVIAMTAVQICAAAEGTAQAAASEVTPVSISTNEIAGWPAGPEITSETGVLMMQTAELFCTARAEMKSVIRQVLPKS